MFRVLSNMARSKFDLRLKLLNEGALEVVFTSIQQYANSVLVLQQGLCALGNLLFTKNEAKDANEPTSLAGLLPKIATFAASCMKCEVSILPMTRR